MKKITKNQIINILILFFFVLTAVFEFVPIQYSESEVHNRFLSKIVPLLFGIAAVYLLLYKSGAKVFSKPQKLLYFLPCLVVAVNNFPFFSYFSGNMQIVHTEFLDVCLFIVNCIAVGFFEEGVFRGILIPVLAGFFPKNKKGLWLTLISSSAIFGGIHLFNLAYGAGFVPTILQVGYSFLTGGMFAFVLIKTKNLLLCAATHAIYNAAGLICSAEGLGAGVVFDLPTGLCMGIVAAIVFVFVLLCVHKYSQEEQDELYQKLGFGLEKK